MVVWLGVVVVVRDGEVAPAGVVDRAPAGGPVAWAANAVVIANKRAIEKILRMKASPGGLLLAFYVLFVYYSWDAPLVTKGNAARGEF